MKHKNVDEKIFIFLFMITAIGICAGVFFETFISGSGKQQLASLLEAFLISPKESVSFIKYALKTALNTAIPLAIFFFVPASVFLVPVIPVFMLLKSVSVGFASAMLFETMGNYAFKAAIFSLAIPNIIKLLTYSFIGTASINISISNMRNNKNVLHANARRYTKLYATTAIFLVLISIMEAFIIIY